MDLPIIRTVAILNSAIVCMLFIAALRLLSSTKVMSTELTAQLRTMVVRYEMIHLAAKVCILYLMPLALSSMVNNSVAHIWIMSLIQWYYVSNAIKTTYEQNLSVADCTEPVTTNAEAKNVEKPSLAAILVCGYKIASIRVSTVIARQFLPSPVRLEEISKQDIVVTPKPATKRDEPHVIEHWASVLSIWVILVYPTAAIISYYGSSVAHILITHVDLFVVTNGAILLVVVWMAANILNPIFTSGAEIAKTVQQSIAFINEAGVLDWFKAFCLYKIITPSEHSVQQRNGDRIEIN